MCIVELPFISGDIVYSFIILEVIIHGVVVLEIVAHSFVILGVVVHSVVIIEVIIHGIVIFGIFIVEFCSQNHCYKAITLWYLFFLFFVRLWLQVSLIR
ncbi:hypothetical protein F8M41_001639 [Gigaspora margarita]|uniref:Uncharacterized protein n=1 Tax=Gigaspora margarita TaxID=4874 RepID=A0A8H3XE33_GIGMA|nr:hypothetical protein F8M41_001639 [Gigaspora margarita]